MPEGFGDFLPPVVATLTGNISEFKARMGEARAEMAKVGDEGRSRFGALSKLGGAAMASVGAAAVGIGVAAMHAADTFEAAHARLTTAIANTGARFDAWKSQIAGTDQRMERFGRTNADTEAALAKLTTGLQSPALALKEMSLTADLAAAKGISLAEAAGLIVRVHAGAGRVLKEFGIDMKAAAEPAKELASAEKAHQAAADALAKSQQKVSDLTTVDGAKKKLSVADNIALRNAHDAVAVAQGKLGETTKALTLAQAASSGSTLKGADALDLLAARIKGGAAAQAETFKGKVAALHATTEDLLKNLGLRLIPVIERVATVTLSLVQWFERHRAAAMVLGAAIGGPLVAAMAAFVATEIAAVAPIIAVGAALAALTAGVIYAYNHWPPFRHAVEAVVEWLKGTAWPALQAFAKGAVDVFGAVVSFVRDHWPQIKAVVGAVVDSLVATWNGLRSAAETVWGAIGDVIDAFRDGPMKFVGETVDAVSQAISGHWRELSELTSTTWATIAGVVGAATDALTSAVRAAIAIVRPLVETAWVAIQTATHLVWDQIVLVVRTAWDLIAGAFRVARDEIVTVFNVTLDLLTGHWGRAWHDLTSGIGRIFSDIGDTIGKAFSSMIDGLGHLFDDLAEWGVRLGKALVSGIMKAISGAAGDIAGAIEKAVPGGTAVGGALSHLPGLGFLKAHADGGLFTAPHLGLIAEAGPELVLPLTRPARTRDLLDQAGYTASRAVNEPPATRISNTNFYVDRVVADDPMTMARQLESIAQLKALTSY